MSDKLRVQSFSELLSSILEEYKLNQAIFGIHKSLFYKPKTSSTYATQMFGQYLETPVGPAAGPHTQLARNIISSWLSGGRFIELKTVQIEDELSIPRPCIDVADEGYNVEWSQELRLEDSLHEYINAWVVIHILRRLLGFEEKTPFGTIFNMSVGYDLAGIKQARMVAFMDRMADASQEISDIKKQLAAKWPEYSDIDIPSRLTNNVTLSTMHGCPPEEIEQIASYLLEERGLNTIVKLNPTLLGRDEVLSILHGDLGYSRIEIPDPVFDKDLQYDRAVELIRDMKRLAQAHGLFFGIKLSNTLAVANHRGILPGEEMYMSGRALYPITMTLFYKLMREFEGDLNVSYAGGADALNVVDILSSGACPVTCASELLKPGGYTRLLQFVESIENAMNAKGAASLSDMAQGKLDRLEKAASDARTSARYKKSYHIQEPAKLGSKLEMFDCITAPCSASCPTHQDVPDYAWAIAHGKYDQALSIILATNPLPGITGYICTHVCQTKCTRNDYDESVAIRSLKRYAVEHGKASLAPISRSDARVAIVGAGPSGLSAAYFLALNGVEVTLFEAKDRVGGMPAIAPEFRLPQKIIDEDVERIKNLGVKIELNHPLKTAPEGLLKDGFSAVYVATGFQRDATLDIDGLSGRGVYTAMDMLERVRRGEKVDLGSRILVIGGGNTAIDAARTAARIAAVPTTVVYRRTRAEMPADAEQIDDLIIEGNKIEELLTPIKVIRQGKDIVALRCIRNRLGQEGEDKRPKPIPIEGSEIDIPADSLIIAIGQRADLAFLDGSAVAVTDNARIDVQKTTGATTASHIYAGGDVTRGPATIIEAVADGGRAARAICSELSLDYRNLKEQHPKLSTEDILDIKRARGLKREQIRPRVLPVNKRGGFDLVEQGFTEEQALSEASRCLQCSTVCDKCVDVCPNRANYTYHVTPFEAFLPILNCIDGRLEVVRREQFQVHQERQILHVDDFCNKCGVCETFCVHNGNPEQDKPRLFLEEKEFQEQENNAFRICKSMIRSRNDGHESRLYITANNLEYEDEWVRVSFSAALEVLDMRVKREFTGEKSLKHIGAMVTLLRGVGKSLPFLTKC